MKLHVVIIFLLLHFRFVFGENYLLNGGQESQIDYQVEQTVIPTAGMRNLTLSFVIPQSFTSPTYNQRISGLQIHFSPQPQSKKEIVDERGNKILRAVWAQPGPSIQSQVTLTAYNQTRLEQVVTSSPFPLPSIPIDARIYLQSTAQVPVNDPVIAAKARELTRNAKNEFDAVQRILTWIIDHMRYVLNPPGFDAKYAYQTGRGNCQNYSHLAAAMMRSVGIPVRIVNGVALSRPYEIQTNRGALTMKMAQGRHSWIEVWFDDLKWVPFDPQQTQLFVSNRFIRIEVGIDNEETRNDGLIHWAQSGPAYSRPRFQENFNGNFRLDHVQVMGERQNYGPSKLLLTPRVQTVFVPYVAETIPKPKPPEPPKPVQPAQYTRPFVFGNLDFPANVDFTETYGPVQTQPGNRFEIAKNFMVETAEYVTSQEQYAQIFVLAQPIRLNQISLALHKFGGSGMIWLELLQDEQGVPGQTIATSDIIPVETIPAKTGYDWFGFNFRKENLLLSTGRYWIALGFTGSPIINWFYSYGKPVGPQDGTRYKTIMAPNWSKSLAYEFNYRVEGETY